MDPTSEKAPIKKDSERKHNSPSSPLRKLPILKRESSEQWDTCCSKTDRSFIKFVIQVTMGMIVIVFSMLLIGFGNGTHDTIAFSLISGTMGLFFPHPSIKPESKRGSVPI